jgi:ABC-type polysaccharide/polyol phosphate transport system ATPase subunit
MVIFQQRKRNCFSFIMKAKMMERTIPLNDLAIELDSVGIKFNLNVDKEISLKREGVKAFGRLLRSKRSKDFWALKEVSLTVPGGEILGIIGANGAGKSTLLKIIAGIYPPTEGKIYVKGNLAPLIELGAAFNPELTGAENIFFVGSIYRVPRWQIREKFEQIVEFSGLRRFINSPIKNYSTGMFLRLAFSMVIFFEPDIVLIDEVFAVGDEVFQQKSFEKILSFRERGATIVFVSHDLNLIQQICNRVLVLDRGRVNFIGPPDRAVQAYRQLLTKGGSLGEAPEISIAGESEANLSTVRDGRRWGDRKVEITSVSFVNEQGEVKQVFAPGDYFEARIAYVSRLPEGSEEPIFGVAINTIYKMLLYGPNTLSGNVKGKLRKKGIVRFIIPELPLFDGDYLFSAAVYDQSLSHAYDHHEMMYHFRVIGSERKEFGCVRMAHHWFLE